MSEILSPSSKAILGAAKRVLREKKSIVMTKGGMFDAQFKSLVNTSLRCDFSSSFLREEMEFLCRRGLLDSITRNDAYGDGTIHFLGDGE